MAHLSEDPQASVDRIIKIDQLELGDHICFFRGYYFHHAIVVEIDVKNETYTIIHFSKQMKKDTRKLSDEGVLRIKYKVGGLPREQRVEIAESMFKHFNDKTFVYNLVSNNCEHVATLCATGHSISHQVNAVIDILDLAGNVITKLLKRF